MPILYFAKLDIPEGLLRWIRIRHPSLFRRLNATKIGCSENVNSCHNKMRNLQIYIGFAKIRYTMVIHNLHQRHSEKAIHFVARRFLIAGEWYDLDQQWTDTLITKFQPNCQVIPGNITTFPNLQLHNIDTDRVGFVYLAKYNWTGGDLVILTILEQILRPFPADHPWKSIITRMFSTKIGCTESLNSRFSKYIWAQCVAGIRYVAFRHPTMRAEEKRIHTTRQNLHNGNGEWFNLSAQDQHSIEQEFIIRPRVTGVYERLRTNADIHLIDVFRGLQIGLISWNDIYNNAIRGLMPTA